MKVNVVMLVSHRHHLTYQTIRTLHRHTPKDLFNLTIIDDECSVGCDRDGSNVAYLRIEKTKRITGMARNLGIYWAEKYFGRGDYLYLTDNDMYFTSGWLERLTTQFDLAEDLHDFNFRLLGGWNHPFLQPSGTSLYFGIRSHDAVAGASQLMRWTTWDQYGPLDAHAPGVGQSEDWAFCQKIIKDGGRVGSIYPRVVFNCGLTNSFGKPATGADVMLAELQEAKKIYPDIYWE